MYLLFFLAWQIFVIQLIDLSSRSCHTVWWWLLSPYLHSFFWGSRPSIYLPEAHTVLHHLEFHLQTANTSLPRSIQMYKHRHFTSPAMTSSTIPMIRQNPTLPSSSNTSTAKVVSPKSKLFSFLPDAPRSSGQSLTSLRWTHQSLSAVMSMASIMT